MCGGLFGTRIKYLVQSAECQDLNYRFSFFHAYSYRKKSVAFISFCSNVMNLDFLTLEGGNNTFL